MPRDRATPQWIPVATLDDLWEGDITDVQLGDDLILLVHLAGSDIRAYQGYCPHQKTALAEGKLDGHILTCAAHSWQFDIATGEGVNPKDCRLSRYPVKVENETISVSISGRQMKREKAMEVVRSKKFVGPVLRGMDQDLIEAIEIAIEDDNPDAEVLYEDCGGYVRIHTPRLCRITRKSLEAALGRSFRLSELEPTLSGFAGRMRYMGDEALEWFLERED
jgi:toluene monooxygenase system ferredoxin subunit